MTESRIESDSVLDLTRELPEATLEDRAALRKAANTPLGPARVARLLFALASSVSSEDLARRSHSIGEPFSL